jgi:phospholipid/cholesterol/gamma-HCH transport system substrate-binding protein
MARGKLNRGTQAAAQVRVGIVIILALLFLGYGIFQVGRLFDVFASRYPLYTHLQGTGGIIEGSPVTLAGQRVGQVDEIRFLAPDERTDSLNILVRLSINEDVREQIREGSRAALQTQGLLGDRFIDISPGSGARPPLAAGDTLPSLAALDFESVLRTAAVTMEEVQMVVTDLRTITDGIARGEGTLGALLEDDQLYQELSTATSELAGLLVTVRDSDGTLARLIDDPTLYRRLNGAIARVDSVGAVALGGGGSLGRLMRDDALYDGLVGVVGRADSALSGIEDVVGSAARGDGALARLLEDPELYDELLRTVTDLQTLIRQVRENPEALSPEIRVF